MWEEKARRCASASFVRVCRAPTPAALWFSHNTQLGPPYHVILDTNFINFCVKNKLDIVHGLMDCLLAKVRAQPLVRTDGGGDTLRVGVSLRKAVR
jgi:U3 small nucleolar RNA-associated protein 24